ncbi:MAG: hypothetical protein NT105_09885 [Verrucomicrobia bacterium]|nr:hypothetical protein [Verrucomicrobiota bacterium]
MQTDNKSSSEMTAVHPSGRPMVHLHLTRRVYVVLLLLLIAPWGMLAAAWLARDLLLSLQTSRASAKTETGGRVTYAKPGPWGVLRCTRIAIEPPEEEIFIKPEDEAPPRWRFVGFTLNKVRDLFITAGFKPEQVVFLIDRTTVDPATGTPVTSPPPEFVLEMPVETRQKLYHVLAAFPENPSQKFAASLRPEYMDEHFEGSELPHAIIADIRRMLYPHGNVLLFADSNILLPRMGSEREKICLIKTLARKNTLLVNLEVNANSDVSALVRYWGVGGRIKDIDPLLESLRRTPGGASVDISHLLPRFVRARVYTFPYPSGPKIEASRDCHWTSLNFSSMKPDDRFADPKFAYETIRNGYYVISTGVQLGDLMLLVNSKGQLVHSAVYIADDIVFTKNGTQPTHPWMFMKMADLLELYEGALQTEGPLQVMYYRKRAE